jgi:uncharacterized protein (DUF58 family)
MKGVRKVREGIAGRLDRWLFRTRTRENAPIVLGQRRIFVLPTGAGLGFAGALLIMLVASINYNLSLGYGLVFLLTGVAVVSIVHAFRNLLNLSITPGRAEPIFAGETARFGFLVHNPRNADRPALRLRSHEAYTPFALQAYETADVTLPRRSSRRGWLQPGRLVLETRYPLGLIRAWSILTPDMRCLVFPAPESNPPPLPEGRSGSTGRPDRRSGDEDFAGLRAHQSADSPRHVAWKVVARGGPLLTKTFSGTEGGTLHLTWDATSAELDTEARIARLTAWVIAADNRDQPFSLRLPGARIGADRGTPHVHNCLRQLALFGHDDRDH